MATRFTLVQALVAAVGATLAVGVLAWVSFSTQALLLLGSFGASSLLMFALPEAPLSQPRAVVGGHLLASAVALGCFALLGPHWWAVAAATGLGVALMMLTRTLHPPAGSNAIIVFLAKPSWGLLLFSTLAGTVFLVIAAMVYHRTTRRHRYPIRLGA